VFIQQVIFHWRKS